MSGSFDIEQVLAQARHKEADNDDARLAIRLLDLTSLNDDDSVLTIENLCAQASTPAGPVAAVCVFPRFVDTAVRALNGPAIRVATVVSFPHGKDDAHTITNMTLDAINAGAGEIDIVMNYEALMQGDDATVRGALKACRKACTGHVKMKVILESSLYSSEDVLARACRVALEEGADFLKTSTGKVQTGATLEDAVVILRTIRQFCIQTDNYHKIGFKASGGIRTTQQAAQYMELARLIMGDKWICPETFRFGASSLKDDLLKTLGLTAAPDTNQPTE